MILTASRQEWQPRVPNVLSSTTISRGHRLNTREAAKMTRYDDSGLPLSRLFLRCLVAVSVGPICHADLPLPRTGLIATSVTSNYQQVDYPVWYDTDQCVFFVDQKSQLVINYVLQTGETVDIGTEPLGFKFVVPVLSDRPRFVGGDGYKITLFSWDGVGNRATDENSMKVITNTNEGFVCGAADTKRRLWIGTKSSDTEGKVYMVDMEGNINVEIEKMGVPRAIAFSSSQNRMYLADSTKNAIVAYNFDMDTGKLIQPVYEIFNFAAKNVTCSATGIAIDVDGNLWIACNNQNYVIQIDIELSHLIQVLTTVTLPGENSVTNVIFGGQHMQDLYVTTSYNLFHVTGTGTAGLTDLKLEVKWPPRVYD